MTNITGILLEWFFSIHSDDFCELISCNKTIIQWRYFHGELNHSKFKLCKLQRVSLLNLFFFFFFVLKGYMGCCLAIQFYQCFQKGKKKVNPKESIQKSLELVLYTVPFSPFSCSANTSCLVVFPNSYTFLFN